MFVNVIISDIIFFFFSAITSVSACDGEDDKGAPCQFVHRLIQQPYYCELAGIAVPASAAGNKWHLGTTVCQYIQ